jgi:hypothetical protein
MELARLGRFMAVLSVFFTVLGSASALTVTLSANPVDCMDGFGVTAQFTNDSMNTVVEFYADNYLFSTKNPAGQTETSAYFGSDSDDKEHIGPGAHNITARLLRQNTLIEEGTTEIEVYGRRCPKPTTTTTTTTPAGPISCQDNQVCPSSSAEPAYCSADTVMQVIRWGECLNPGTPQSKCVDLMENMTVEICYPDRVCADGKCQPKEGETTTTTTAEPQTTTSTVPPEYASSSTTDSTTTSSTSTSSTTTSSTTTSTYPYIFERTNTKLDKLLDVIEAIIRALTFSN